MDISELLITSSLVSEQSACLWDFNTGNVLKVYRSGGVLAPKCLEFVAQNYMIGCESEKPIMHVWPLNNQDTKSRRIILPGPATCITVCPKSFYLVAGIGCKVYIWQLASGKLLSVHQKNYQPVTVVKFSSNGEYLLVAGQDGILSVYNFAALVNLSTSFMTQSDIGEIEPIYVKNDHSMPITDVHVGTFGRKSRFATVSSDQTCRVYNLSDGEPLLTLIFEKPLTAVTFDSPCWQLFIGNSRGIINQFSLKESATKSHSHHINEKNETLTFNGHTSKVTCIAVNITNTLMASTAEDSTVLLWEIRSRQIMKRIEHKAEVTNVKFVLGHQNFFVEKLMPCAVLKNFEREVVVSNVRLPLSRIQLKDLEFDDSDTISAKDSCLNVLASENVKLRCINKQLFSAALEMSKKYNLN